MSERPLRIIVVEDEEAQRNQLVSWLLEDPTTVVVDVASDAPAAVTKIESQRPDLLLLDISLPGFSGLAVLDRVSEKPDVIFTTAHRDYAVEAFELGAVDYLLKPFARERLAAALSRARNRRSIEASFDEHPVSERVAAYMDRDRPLDRVFVRERGAVIPVPVNAIVRLQADGEYTAIYSTDKRHLLALPLKTLHERLPRADFLRVHRRHIVNLAFVLRIEPYDAARVEVFLRGGSSVVASRGGSLALRRLARI